MLDASLARLFVGARVERRIRTIDMLRGLASVALVATLSCGDAATEPPQPDPPRATTVTVAPAAVELNGLGAISQLTAEVHDQNNQPMARAAVSWSSSDATVATVDAQGLVTAVGTVTVTIIATAGGAARSMAVSVEQEVVALGGLPAADTLLWYGEPGDTLRF